MGWYRINIAAEQDSYYIYLTHLGTPRVDYSHSEPI